MKMSGSDFVRLKYKIVLQSDFHNHIIRYRISWRYPKRQWLRVCEILFSSTNEAKAFELSGVGVAAGHEIDACGLDGAVA